MSFWSAVGVAVLALTLAGCESLQRKFTRKSKQEEKPPTPIIQFQDYTRTMTPLDRYRKHYMMFDYWNQDLIDSLQGNSPNPKRYRRASSEALSELRTMKALVTDDMAPRFDSLLKERENIDQQIQQTDVGFTQAQLLRRELEMQERQVHRELFWRQVEDQIKPWPAQPVATSPEEHAPAH